MKTKKISKVFCCPFCGYKCSRSQIFAPKEVTYSPLTRNPKFYNIVGFPETLNITLTSEQLIHEETVAPRGEYSVLYLNIPDEKSSRIPIGYTCPKCKETVPLNALTEKVEYGFDYF